MNDITNVVHGAEEASKAINRVRKFAPVKPTINGHLSTIADRGRRLSGSPARVEEGGFRLLPSLPERLLPLFGSHRSRRAAATASPRGCSRPRLWWRPCA